MGLLDSVLSAGTAAIGRSATADSGLLPVLIDLLSNNGEIGGLQGCLLYTSPSPRDS